MNPHSTQAVRRSLALLPTAWVAVAPRLAAAQSTGPTVGDGATVRSELPQVLGRLDATALGLIAVALLILVLLIWRVATMVRRERAVPVPQPRKPRMAGDKSADTDPLDRPTLQRSTDWGFDQNKRAAQVRSPVAIKSSDVDLPSLEHAVTQWSISDVEHAGNIDVLPDDALGKSPHAVQSPYRTSFNPYFRREQLNPRYEVVEVADVLLQAELLVQLGDPKQAMTLLSQHIRETEKPGPAVWLMLLDLYQSTGRESQYNALSAGFRMLFNAEVPPWATPAENARDLESYLQVLSRVQIAWANGQARATIDALLNDDRGGSRQGFSLASYRELLFLVDVLDGLDAMGVDEDERSGIRRKLQSPA